MEKNYLEREIAYLKDCIKELEEERAAMYQKIGALEWENEYIKKHSILLEDAIKEVD